MPPTTTKEQFQAMLQNLLEERFALRIHREPREQPVYELRIGAKGHKLKESTFATQESAPAQGGRSNQLDKDGFPISPPGSRSERFRQETGPAGEVVQYWVYPDVSPKVLADYLTQLAGRIVVDKTDLTGRYDVRLKVQQRQQAPGIPVILTIFDAVVDQLGLQLVDTKASIDYFVIDSANSDPTEN
jgi:uncharacterized protein (TIGR03435 family)